MIIILREKGEKYMSRISKKNIKRCTGGNVSVKQHDNGICRKRK